jgi:hypothetical protein
MTEFCADVAAAAQNSMNLASRLPQTRTILLPHRQLFSTKFANRLCRLLARVGSCSWVHFQLLSVNPSVMEGSLVLTRPVLFCEAFYYGVFYCILWFNSFI